MKLFLIGTRVKSLFLRKLCRHGQRPSTTNLSRAYTRRSRARLFEDALLKKLCQIEIQVSDMETSLRFYEQVFRLEEVAR